MVLMTTDGACRFSYLIYIALEYLKLIVFIVKIHSGEMSESNWFWESHWFLLWIASAEDHWKNKYME